MNQSSPNQELVLRSSGPLVLTTPRRYAFENYSGFEKDTRPSEASSGILEYWRIIKRRRLSVFLLAACGLLSAILITLPQSPSYRARTTVEIQNMNNDFLNSRQINPVALGDSAVNVLTDVQTQMKVLESENLVERVLTRMRAEHKLADATPKSGARGWIRQWLHLPPKNAIAEEYRFRNGVMARLMVRQLGETRMIEAVFTSDDPRFAANFLNTLDAEYIQSNIEARWKMSERTGEWLGAQLDGMRRKLEDSEAALQHYAKRTNLLFATPSIGGGTDKVNISEDKLRQLQDELSRAQADRTIAQAKYETAQTATPDSLGDILNDQSLRDLRSKVTDLKRQQAELITIYTPKDERVKMIEAQIEPLEAEFQKERTAILERIYNDYSATTRREKLLQAAFASQSQAVTDQADKSIQYNILKREADSNRQIYESVLQQVKEASVASAIRASNIRIVDPAELPTEPYSPNLPLNASLGLFAGVFAGAVFALVQERRDRTIQVPGETPFWTKVPELGAIPSIKLGALAMKDMSNLQAADVSLLGSGTKVFDAPKMDLIAWNQKLGIVAEAFRTVLASILFNGEDGNRAQVFAFTSDSPNDGKTTTVSNLAIVAAEVRRRVLIIDADLRRPRMHTLFGIENDSGLATLLNGDVPEAEFENFIRKTFVPNLYVIPSGPSASTVSHLLHSSHFPTILSRLKKQFDMILIDTTPVLQVTDARIIGRLADGVILVTRANYTTRDAITTVRQRFAEDGTNIIGTILNDWNPQDSSISHYGYSIRYSHSRQNPIRRYFKQNTNYL